MLKQYIVQSGDTLSGIIRDHYGWCTTQPSDEMIALLADYNHINDPNLIDVDQRLFLPPVLSLVLNKHKHVLDQCKAQVIPRQFYVHDQATEISGLDIRAFWQDALNVSADGAVVDNCRIFDMLDDTGEAHRDGIQLIPRDVPESLFMGNFSAAILSDVTVSNNELYSNGMMQCIFSSDGLLNNIQVTGNTITTQSPHKITLGGLMSGTISNNKDADGNYVPVKLDPLRIGGNAERDDELHQGITHIENLYVHGFSSNKYQYQPLDQICDSETLNNVNVEDNRFHFSDAYLANEKNQGNVYLDNFRLDEFHQKIMNETGEFKKLPDQYAKTQKIKEIALGFGDKR